MKRFVIAVLLAMVNVICFSQQVINELTIDFESGDDFQFIPIYFNDIDNPGTFGVRNGAFEINDMEGTQCTPPFSITNGFNDNQGILLSGVATMEYCNVSIQLLTSISSTVFESCLNPSELNPYGCTDFLESGPGGDAMLIEIRKGGEVVLTAGYCGSNREGQFTVTDLTVSPGEQLQVTITGGTQAIDESYFINEIRVAGIPRSILGAQLVTSSENLCVGREPLIISEVTGGSNYRWEKDGVALTHTSNTITITDVSLSDMGTYTVTFTESGGCEASGSVYVKVTDCDNFSAVYAPADIEADKILGDSIIAPWIISKQFIGDGSRLTGINKDAQNLYVAPQGDTLYISEGNWVIIPGLSAANSGNAFANAGSDILNACVTTFQLSASELSEGTTGQWIIIAGNGGSLVNPTSTNATFYGVEGESYLLQWNVSNPNGSGSFDQLNISISDNTMTSVADAGKDSLAIMTQTIQLYANNPQADSEGRWAILSGQGGILEDSTDPQSNFTGVQSESYTLRWQHYNDCSTSSDEIILTFSESASGVPSANGRYYIPDSKFRQYLQIAYSSIMDGDSLIVSDAPNITTINMANLGVTNLDGLQFFTDLKILNLNDNGELVSIPFFSNVLKQFNCTSCTSLKILPEFPQSLDSIIITYAYPIEKLPDLPDTMKYVRLYSIGQNLIHNLKIPELTKEYYISYMNFNQFPELPNDPSHLVILQISRSNLPVMPSLREFVNLNALELNENALLKIDSLPENLVGIDLYNNPIICVENKPASIANQLSDYPLCQ